MDTRTRRYLISGASLLGGFLLVALVTFVVRPLQTDGAHLMGTLTVKGGVVIHAGEFELGKGLFGWYTANLTGTATELHPKQPSSARAAHLEQGSSVVRT
jgi:hypothetical protein